MAMLRRSITFPLAGRTVVVTGAARGIGAAVATAAHARGATVAVLDIDLQAATTTAKSLGDRAFAVRADIRDLAGLEVAAADIRQRFGGIDVVVANAGIAPPSRTVLTIGPADFERTIEIDLLGQWRTVRAMLPDIVERRGHVVIVSSIYAFTNGALNASYAISKAGVEQLARALRAELAVHGASAGVAYFGFVETDLAATVFAQPQVATARHALPAFLTRPISAKRAAEALVTGVEARAARITAPAWVAPALLTRGLLDPLLDAATARLFARAVRQAEASASQAAAAPRPVTDLDAP